MRERPTEYELRAQMLRILAAAHRQRAAELDAAAAAVSTGGSMQKFASLLTEAEARDVAQHPDLAELNVQLDALYGAAPEHSDEEPT
ncbi:hypothetical protein [Streptomyces griseofuscus]|uniref:hypothetical protein n=1 Tax=Streptomyces griseofuscus TaxID=146922 RepID=UPI0033E871EC